MRTTAINTCLLGGLTGGLSFGKTISWANSLVRIFSPSPQTRGGGFLGTTAVKKPRWNHDRLNWSEIRMIVQSMWIISHTYLVGGKRTPPWSSTAEPWASWMESPDRYPQGQNWSQEALVKWHLTQGIGRYVRHRTLKRFPQHPVNNALRLPSISTVLDSKERSGFSFAFSKTGAGAVSFAWAVFIGKCFFVTTAKHVKQKNRLNDAMVNVDNLTASDYDSDPSWLSAQTHHSTWAKEKRMLLLRRYA